MVQAASGLADGAQSSTANNINNIQKQTIIQRIEGRPM